jgi:hypothetical protein
MAPSLVVLGQVVSCSQLAGYLLKQWMNIGFPKESSHDLGFYRTLEKFIPKLRLSLIASEDVP